MNRRRVACWKYGPPSRVFNSTPATFSTGRSPANRANPIRADRASVSKHSTIPTHQTDRTSQPRCCGKALPTTQSLSIASRPKGNQFVFIRVLLVLALVAFTPQSQAPPPYKNASLSVDERVADLLKRMTLEEKVAQLTCIWPQGRDIPPDALKNGIGQIARQQ